MKVCIICTSVEFTANGPAIKLVGVAERMEVVTTNFSSG